MKIKHVLLTASLLLATTSLTAKNVDVLTAEKVAKNFYYQQNNLYEEPIKFDAITIVNRYTESRGDNDLLYIFEFSDGKFVVVSAEDTMSPVVAFIEQNDGWNLEEANPGLQFMMRKYSNMIEELRETKHAQDKAIAAEWNLYTTDDQASLLKTTKSEEIGPLLNTVWNQDYPYNFYAPEAPSGPGGRCYAGCVATAMSVLMEYWRWPDHGEGTSTFYSSIGGFLTADYENTYYNYDAMLTSINSTSEEEAIYANAIMQYQAGIGVQMQYAPDGSGAFSPIVPFVMSTHFRYSEDIELLTKDEGYTQDQWNTHIYNELSQKHVLYYAGCDPAGCHAFNCDGYRNTNGSPYHHFNFNWGGSGNGWFVATNPGGYNSSEDILINAVPDTENNVYPQYASGVKTLIAKVGRVNDGSGPLYDYIPTEAAWLIDPANNPGDSITDITLSWESFELANGDVVKVYDGGNENAPLLGEYTGTTLPETVTSTGDQMYITLSASSSGPGFTFIYTAERPIYCTGMTNTGEDPFYIESSPEGKFYQPRSLCRYSVKYPGKGVKIAFDYLDTYDGEDYIEIFDVASNVLYGPFFGNELPENIITEGEAYITFKSDNFNSNNQGFALTCSSFDGIDDCKESIVNLEVYPNPADKNVSITFNNNHCNTAECKVLDIKGGTLFAKEYNNCSGIISETIDVSSYKSGVYVIQIINNDGITTKKLIIQ